MSKLPYMPLWVGDYLKDTRHLTTEEHGAYLLLIMEYWLKGGIQGNDEQLARIVGLPLQKWTRIRPVVQELFTDGWQHKRIDVELDKASSKSKASRQNGSKGAARKWGDDVGGAASTRSQRLSEARKKGTHSAEEWESLVEYCDHKCVRCSADRPVVKDHIKPIYQGGSDAIENLQPLCTSCNSSKGPDNTDHRAPGWRKYLFEQTPSKMPGEMPSQTPSKCPANA